jgi:hypothetical protein
VLGFDATGVLVVGAGGTSSLYRGDWATATVYNVGEALYHDGSLYRVRVGFTSGGSFDPTNLDHVAQDIPDIVYPAATLVAAGHEISIGGSIWEANATHTTAATFTDAEKALWTQVSSASRGEIRSLFGPATHTVLGWDDLIVCYTLAGDVTITLPGTLPAGERVTIQKSTAAGQVIINGTLVTTAGVNAATDTLTALNTAVSYAFTGSRWVPTDYRPGVAATGAVYAGEVPNVVARLALPDSPGQSAYQADGGSLGRGGMYQQIRTPATSNANWILVGERLYDSTYDATGLTTFDATDVTFDVTG